MEYKSKELVARSYHHAKEICHSMTRNGYSLMGKKGYFPNMLLFFTKPWGRQSPQFNQEVLNAFIKLT